MSDREDGHQGKEHTRVRDSAPVVPLWLEETTLTDRFALAVSTVGSAIALYGSVLGSSPLWLATIPAVLWVVVVAFARSAVAERRLKNPEQLTDRVLDEDVEEDRRD